MRLTDAQKIVISIFEKYDHLFTNGSWRKQWWIPSVKGISIENKVIEELEEKGIVRVDDARRGIYLIARLVKEV